MILQIFSIVIEIRVYKTVISSYKSEIQDYEEQIERYKTDYMNM